MVTRRHLRSPDRPPPSPRRAPGDRPNRAGLRHRSLRPGALRAAARPRRRGLRDAPGPSARAGAGPPGPGPGLRHVQGRCGRRDLRLRGSDPAGPAIRRPLLGARERLGRFRRGPGHDDRPRGTRRGRARSDDRGTGERLRPPGILGPRSPWRGRRRLPLHGRAGRADACRTRSSTRSTATSTPSSGWHKNHEDYARAAARVPPRSHLLKQFDFTAPPRASGREPLVASEPSDPRPAVGRRRCGPGGGRLVAGTSLRLVPSPTTRWL